MSWVRVLSTIELSVETRITLEAFLVLCLFFARAHIIGTRTPSSQD
jgi:hypothetical protein